MKWSVGKKILSINLVAILVFIALGYLNYYSTHHMLETITWQQQSLKIKETLQEIMVLLVDSETGHRGYLLTKQDHFLEPYRNSMTQLPNKIALLKNYFSIDKAEINQQKKLDVLMLAISKKNAFMQQSMNLKDQAQVLAVLENGKKAMDNIRQIIREMLNNEDKILVQRIKTTQASVDQTTYIIIYGTLFITILIISLSILLIKNIAKPLKEITAVSQKISLGELDTDIQVLNRQDEIGLLTRTFSRMVKVLRNYTHVATAVAKGDLTVSLTPQSQKDSLGNAISLMLHNMQKFVQENNETIKSLNLAVNEILTSISQFVSTGNETATAVSETTSTIEEVRQTSQVTSQKSKSVADNAQFAAEISQTGNKAIQETNEGIKRIRDQMDSIAHSMMLLSDQTQGISSIVETVDDLAQQSNLLSVNASIEAEKAGEQGKGFRVVAQEIKSLADQSKQATHRVREILTDVQKATNAAVLATEQGSKVADGGVKKSEETGESIVKLTSTITQSTQAAIQIAASSQQQLVGMEQAAMAMENIKQASVQSVESAKQLGILVEDLKKIVIKLQHLIKTYRVATIMKETDLTYNTDIADSAIEKAKLVPVD